MKNKLILLLLLVSSHLFAAENVTISGNAPEYANSEIQFYRHIDPVTKEKLELFKLKIDQSGSFHSNLKLESVIRAQADFDSYSAFIYLVPGKNYEIILPPKKEITSGQRNNPFFKPVKIHLANKGGDKNELNRKIREFERAYIKTENSLFNKIYRQRSKAAVDSVKSILLRQFPSGTDSFFETYKHYRLAFIDFSFHQGQNKEFLQTYFNTSKPNFEATVFQDLFDRVFTNYFSRLANSINGDEFKKVLASSKPIALESYLKEKDKLDSEMTRLILLKAINDVFYQGQFSQTGLLKLLSAIQQTNWTAEQKQLAERLKKKLAHLLEDTAAPYLSMQTFEGENKTLVEYRDKICYLHFTRVENPLCRQHLDELNKLPEAVLNDIHILHLILEEEIKQVEMIKRKNWPGEFLIVSENDAKNWKVMTFPTSYLIDEKGMLIKSPALNPLNGFNRQIGTMLQKRHMEKLRNQAR